jgi:hypothetical protein
MSPQAKEAQDQTLQERMKATLEKAGIPAKDISCYGSQVMILAYGRESAEKWAALLAGFCRKLYPVRETIVENKVNRNTVLRPSCHKLWRVWGTV